MDEKFIIEEWEKKYLPDVAELWKRMISYCYLTEQNFEITEDCEIRYLRYLESIYIDNLTKIIIARDDCSILGFMIGEISIRPPVIVKGHLGIIGDYWTNKLYLSRDSQQEVKNELFLNILEWFTLKKVERIRMEVSTMMDDDRQLWESLGFQSNKWVMYK